MVSVGKYFLGLVLGFVIGAFLAVMMFDKEKLETKPKVPIKSERGRTGREKTWYERWLFSEGVKVNPYSIKDQYLKKKYKTEADFLFSRVSVTCVVFFKKVDNAYTAKYTWGQKCNRMVFYGDKNDSYLESNAIKHKTTWELLCNSLRHLWDVYREGLQWAIFVPDDVFVIPENVRFMVAAKNSSRPHYIGHNSVFWNQLYNSGRAGYVLSSGAIDLLVSRFTSSNACTQAVRYNKNEDYHLGKFLSELGVRAEDGRDDENRERFHGFTPGQLMAPGNFHVIERYSRKSLHPVLQGEKCCSSTSISFRGPEEDLIFLYSFLMYTVGLFRGYPPFPERPNKFTKSDQVWQRVVIEELGPGVDLSKISADVYYRLWSLKENSPQDFNRKIREEVIGKS